MSVGQTRFAPLSGVQPAPSPAKEIIAQSSLDVYSKDVTKFAGTKSERLKLPTLFADRAPATLTKTLNVPFIFPDENGIPRSISQEVDFLRPAPKLAGNSKVTGIFDTTEEDIQVIKGILPSIVRVAARDDNGGWYGSGSLVDPMDIIPDYIPEEGEYFVLTNQHVADDAKYLTVKLANGLEYQAEVVTSPDGARLIDEEMDVALMRVRIPMSVQTVKIGDPKALEIGQPIYTAGHPLAFPNVAVTKGIISNPQQETGALSLDIQSDAPINPGNSGGPSFNRNGEIIGLNTYSYINTENLTFTKPVDEQIDTLLALWYNGRLSRGTLNFDVKQLSLIDRLQMGFPVDETGAIVKAVKAGSSAEKAGLKVNDIVTWMEVLSTGAAVDILDVDIHDRYEADGVIKRWAAKQLPGTSIHMIVYRKVLNSYVPMEMDLKVEELGN